MQGTRIVMGAILLLSMLSLETVSADVIRLKNGNVIEGEIEVNDGQQVIVEIPGLGTMTLQKDEISSIETSQAQQGSTELSTPSTPEARETPAPSGLAHEEALASQEEILASKERFPVLRNGKWGYINETGKLVIPYQFDTGDYRFSEGLANVEIGHTWGYIDQAGRMVIAPQFSTAWPFREGLAVIRSQGRWGYIDKTGAVVIPPQFDESVSFSHGLARVKVGGKFGYIDKTGRYVVQPQFENAGDFSDGLAAVMPRAIWGFIDTKGKMVIQPQFLNAYDFHEGMAEVTTHKGEEGERLLINKQGNAVLSRSGLGLSFGDRCSEGLIAVWVDGRWGYADKMGKFVISPQFERAGVFSEGLAAVKVGGKVGYIDSTGIVVIPPQFDKFSNFHGGMATVEVVRRLGYIDRTGKTVIEPQFADAEPFYGSLAKVHKAQSDTWGYIDKTGRVVWQSE